MVVPPPAGYSPMVSRGSSKHKLPAQEPYVKCFRICMCIILVLAISSLSRAQEFRGSLIGEVEDSVGGRIASAKITIRATESSFERQVTADSQGQFRIRSEEHTSELQSPVHL